MFCIVLCKYKCYAILFFIIQFLFFSFLILSILIIYLIFDYDSFEMTFFLKNLLIVPNPSSIKFNTIMVSEKNKKK